MARVLLMGTSAHPSGAALALLRLARGLRDRGHRTEAYFLYQLEEICSPVHPFSVLHPVVKPTPLNYAIISAQTISLVLRERPEALITFLPLASVLGQSAASLAGVPVRVVSHRVVANTYGRAIRAADGLLARLGAYTTVFAVSEAVRASCKHYPACLRRNIRLARNGLPRWSVSKFTKNEARKRFGLPEASFVLLALGRLEEQKNPNILLNAISPIPNIHLLFAGDGSLRANLESDAAELKIAHRVHFLGTVPQSEVPDLLGAADVFVQPSLFEGQSNALLEAMTAGVPVLVSDIPEQREVLVEPDGFIRAGKLIATNKPEAWTDAIIEYLRDPKQAELAGAAAARRSRAFSYEAMIDAYELVLV